MAGLERAKARGKRIGRPPVSLSVIQKIKKLRKQGLSLRAVSSKLKIPLTTVHKFA